MLHGYNAPTPESVGSRELLAVLSHSILHWDRIPGAVVGPFVVPADFRLPIGNVIPPSSPIGPTVRRPECHAAGDGHGRLFPGQAGSHKQPVAPPEAKFSACKIGAILLQSLKQTQGRVTMLQGGCPLPLPAPGRDPGAVDPAVSPHRSVQGASKSRQKSTPGVHFSRWNQFRWNQFAAAVFTVSTPNGAGICAVARSPESITQNPISPRGRIRPQCPGHSRLGKVVSFQQSFQQRGTGLCTGRPGLCSPGAIWPDCIWPDS